MKKYIIKNPHEMSNNMKKLKDTENEGSKRVRKAVKQAEKTLDEDRVKLDLLKEIVRYDPNYKIGAVDNLNLTSSEIEALDPQAQ